MKRLRFLAVFMAAAMAASMLASCADGGQGESKASSSKKVSEGSVSEAEAPVVTGTNRFGWDVPAETIEITAFNANGEYAPSEEEKAGRANMEKYVLENFNVKLNMETTDGDGTEALNLALASDSYPDVIFNIEYDMMLKFKDQNKLQDLTPYMDTIGKDLKERIGDIYPMLLDDEEKLWYIPTDANELMDFPGGGAHIRYDEWQQIGSPKFETPDDYYQALKKILEEKPTTENGETRYAMSLYNDQNYIRDFAGFWGLKNGWKIDDEKNFTYWTNTEEGKAMTKWFNQIYRDGLFDPDAFNNTFDDWKAKFSNERIVGAVGQWWTVYNAGHEVWQALDPNVDENKRFIQVGFKAPEAEKAYITPKNRAGSSHTVITDKAEHTEDILKFINFEATDVGLALFYWGIPNGVPVSEGSDETVREWNIDEDGKWAVDETAKEQFISETWDYNKEALLGTATYTFFGTLDRWSDGESHIWLSHMWFDQNKWKTIMIDNLKDTVYDATPMTIFGKDADTALTEQALRDSWTQYWPMVVQSQTDEEFDANWKTLQDSVNGAGLEGYTQTLQESYRKNLEKLEK